MKYAIKKFGEVSVFVLIALLFLATGYVSWGHGSPEVPAWFMPVITLLTFGSGVWLLYASMAELSQNLSSKNDGLGSTPRR
jgi:hypothetical protein